MATARIARNLGRLVVHHPGTTDKVTFAAHAGQRVGASDQSGGSLVFWMRAFGHLGAEQDWVVLTGDANNYISVATALSNGAFQVVVQKSAATVLNVNTGVFPQAGKLHCVVLAWDATSLILYVDGTPVSTNVGDFRPVMPATVSLQFGTYGAFTSVAANGEIGGEAYLYARKLTRGEIMAHYYKGVIPETPASAWGPRGWNPGGASGGTITLTGGSGNNGVVTNGVTMPERGDRAGRQRGLGLHATRTSPSTAGQSAGWQVADTAALKPQSFTIECRVRFDNHAAGLGTNYRGIIVKTTGVAWNDGWGLTEIATVEGRTIRMWVGAYSTGATFALAPSTREIHVAGTYDYVSGVAQMFVEGVLVASWNAGAGLAQAAVPLRMCHGYNGAGGYLLRGTLRDVRYYSRVLNAQEIELRAEKHVDIESGLIEAWRLDEAVLQGTSIPTPGPAKGRVAGLDATWNNDVFACDAEGAPDVAPLAKASASRWLQASGLGSARTSTTYAALKPGSGSFSLAFTVRLVDGRASTNIVITANDGVSYVNGWALNFLIATDGTYTLSAYVNSGGPVVSNSGTGQRTIPRNKTTRWVLTCDSSTGTVKMYANGKIFAQSTPGFVWNITTNCAFGVGYEGAVGWGPGMQIGDVQYAVGKLWNQEEILLDAKGIEDSLSGVTHAWPMNETSGTSFRATKGGIDLNTITGTFVEPFQALPDAPRKQNLFKYSEQINNAVWLKSNLTATPNTTLAPRGGEIAAETITDTTDGGNTQHYFEQSLSGFSNAGDVMIASAYVKAGTKTAFGIAPNAAATGFTFNLSTGSVGSQINSVPLDQGIEDVGGGWYRCWVKFAYVAGTNVRFYIANNTASVLYTGAGNGTVLVWGVQIAVVDQLAEYVKTEGGVESSPADRGSPLTSETFERRCWLYTDPADATVDGSNFVLTAPGRAPGARGWAQATPSKRPTRVTGGLDGHPYFNYDGGDVLQAASAFVTDTSTSSARADWLIAAVIDPNSATGSQAVFDSFESVSSDRVLVTTSGYLTSGKASWYDGAWNEPANSTVGPQFVMWDLRQGKGRFYRSGVWLGGEGNFRRRMMDDLSVSLGGNFDLVSGFFLGKIYDFAIIKNPTDADVLLALDHFRFKFPSLNIDPDM